MNINHTLSTKITKIIGSIMTVAFSLMAFAYGQSCTLLPGFTPSTLVNGVSRIAFQIPEATFTQSCADAQWTIVCDNGTVTNGNIYKYPSCIPHMRSGCTTPVVANHLEYKTLYKASTSNYTQNCSQLSKSLQCLNGIFTGWTTPSLYSFGSCTDPNRSQCVDIWTTSYKDHGETVIGYLSTTPTIWQTCTSLQKTLTCMNGTRSGGVQTSLVTGCTNPAVFSWCTNPRTNISLPHNTVVNAYTSPAGVCSGLVRQLTCINGSRSGYNSSLSSGCVDMTTQPCSLSVIGMWSGWTAPHGTFVNKYTQKYAFQNTNNYCVDYIKTLQCVNSIRSGNVPGLYTWCNNVAAGSCFDPHTNRRVDPAGYVYRYTSSQPLSTTTGCDKLKVKLTCDNGFRSGWSISMSPTCGNCILPRWTILPEWATAIWYSARLRETTWVNYIGWCAPFSWQFICTNSILQWIGTWWAYPPKNYKYTLAQCTSDFAPRDCVGWSWVIWGWLWGTILHGYANFKTGYSQTGSELPKTCDQHYAETLTCINGVINGNRQTYKYADCTWETLFNWVDISIKDSKWIAGQEWLPVQLIAQWSSPELIILFKNRWDTTIDTTIAEGFLTCKRNEKNLTVYKSRTINVFTLPAWGKMGQVIRIQPLFTQAEWTKKLICTINPSLLGGGAIDDPANLSNNTWSGEFEVVKADRFDLALSRSIESIKMNLEAAEWAKWAQGLQNFLFNKIMNVLVPLIIIIGILSAILGFYKLMFSSDENAVKEWTRYIVFGVIGIIVIMSAKFIGQNVYDMLTDTAGIEWYKIASGLYDRILFPFIKFAIYLALGAMFVILVSRVITFLFGTDADAQKKAGTLIGWNVISMLVIIWAKQIVEVIYGARDKVVNENITNLGDVGSWVLASKNIPILYDIINYALGIASLVILVIIIIQTVKLLTKPDDPAQIKSIKNSLMYMFIGILILGAGYLIVNFAIIN